MTAAPFADAVPDLLASRGWTQRDLARAVDVDPAHICRLLGPTPVAPTQELLLRVAGVLEISARTFLEHQAWVVADAARNNPNVCERLYRSLPDSDQTAQHGRAGSAGFTTMALLRELGPGPAAPLPREARGRFSREAIIAAILRWEARFGEPPKSIDWDPSRARRRGQAWRAERLAGEDWPSLAMVRRQFGTMSDALSAAGLRPRPRPVRPRGRVLSPEDILAAIQRWDCLYGEPPAMSDWAPARARRLGHEWRVQRYFAGDWPHLTTVLKQFGTFGAAIEAAGLEPRLRGRHVRGDCGIHPDTQASISTQLAAAEGPVGSGVLATRVRAVAQARAENDAPALRGALIDLAAAALSYADAVAPMAAMSNSAA